MWIGAKKTTCVSVCKYFERLRYNASGDRNPNTLKYKTTDERVSKQKSRARHVTRTCPCMTTSIIIKITRDQHVNTFTLIGSQLVVMVLRAQRPLGTIAQFFHFVAEEKKKKKGDKKTKAFYDWATIGIPVKIQGCQIQSWFKDQLQDRIANKGMAWPNYRRFSFPS